MTTAKVLIVQHVPWEKPGRILDSLDDYGVNSQTVNLVQDEAMEDSDVNDFSGLVLMGGPMGAADTETYPGLKTEAKMVRRAVKAGMPVLGVCLGHQIIATALGAKLERAKHAELGFAPISKVACNDYFSMWNKKLNVLHWHGDKVSLPEGAQLLASSEHTKNQAFCYKTAIGFQFHMEVTATLLDEWLAEPKMTENLKKSQIAQIRDDFARYDCEVQPLAEQVFSAFATRCSTYAQSME